MHYFVRLRSFRKQPVYWGISIIIFTPIIGYLLSKFYYPLFIKNLTVEELWLLGLLSSLIILFSLLFQSISRFLVTTFAKEPQKPLSLWLFGSVTFRSDDYSTPSRQILISCSGSFASLFLAVIATYLVTSNSESLANALLIWTISFNFLIAFFNLLPTLPLSGGYILSAFFWYFNKDKEKATASAVRFGQVFSLGFGLLTIVLIARNNAAGFPLLFLAFYLYYQTTTQFQYEHFEKILKNVLVKEVMTPLPPGLPDWLTVQALNLSTKNNTLFPTHNIEGATTGLLLSANLRPTKDSALRLKDLTIPLNKFITTTTDEPLLKLLSKLRTVQNNVALVKDGDTLIATVSPADLLKRYNNLNLQRIG